MEQQIQKLEYGESAQIQYNSGKLKVDKRVNIEQVEKILDSDHASIMKEEEGHTHAHAHASMKWLLGISTGIFLFALLLDFVTAVPAVPFYLTAIILSGY
ncbi:hypothetical protein R0J90_13590, partial [Micrococcus sp. SIMBA_144]